VQTAWRKAFPLVLSLLKMKGGFYHKTNFVADWVLAKRAGPAARGTVPGTGAASAAAAGEFFLFRSSASMVSMFSMQVWTVAYLAAQSETLVMVATRGGEKGARFGLGGL
jgi:hypothetical protein